VRKVAESAEPDQPHCRRSEALSLAEKPGIQGVSPEASGDA
jgi:hypothetical protein